MENFIPNKFKSDLVKRCNEVFSNKDFKEEVDKLTFDQVARVLGDLVHFGYVLPVSRKATELLDSADHPKNIANLVKLLDSIYASDHGIESLDFFLRKADHYLGKQENFSKLNTNQMVRLLRVFAAASHYNLADYYIQNKLCGALEERLHEFEETDVLMLLRTYANLS